MALSQATDGDDVPEPAALLAQALQQRWKKGRTLGKIVKWIGNQIATAVREAIMEAVNSEWGGCQLSVIWGSVEGQKGKSLEWDDSRE